MLNHLKSLLQNYNSIHPEEIISKEKMLEFLDNFIYSNDLENWNVKRGASTHSLYLIGEHVSSPKFCRANSSKQKSITAIGRHLCGKDHYNATYIFLDPNSFTLNYHILGPEKNYNINSRFTKIWNSPIVIIPIEKEK